LEPQRVSILVAEDEEVLRCAYVKSLSKLGYSVIEAVDGKDALSKAREHAGQIHALVTDLNMPNLNGEELARQIKLSRPDIQILIITGLRQNDFATEAVRRYPLLEKPFRLSTLVEVVETLVRSHPGAQPIPSADVQWNELSMAH
jgi:two-component system, cell cycle sensor histidine kinase and response regulator CckA